MGKLQGSYLGVLGPKSVFPREHLSRDEPLCLDSWSDMFPNRASILVVGKERSRTGAAVLALGRDGDPAQLAGSLRLEQAPKRQTQVRRCICSMLKQ